MVGRSPVVADAEQRRELLGLSQSRDRGEADRSRAILLTLRGWTSPEIADAFGVREDTVRLWRSAFMRGGVGTLRATVAPGPAAIKAERALDVAEELLSAPVANRPNWTLPRLASEIEQRSGLRWKQDFFVGYSPERINPGDKEHTLPRIVKLVSGDTPATLERVAAVYGSIIPAGVHRASSIKVAEAAKVIENTQRDLNIALMNELALIFHKIGIDTLEVLEAAGTKWNFLAFRPGLVGGHCIGVDPYYLTHMADKLGYHPQVILAGRRINDGMGKFIAEQTVKQLIQSGASVKGADINVLGLTFKENCPDIRNSRVIDVVQELVSYGANVHVHDPVADPAEARREYGIDLKSWDALPRARAIVAAVAHRDFKRRPTDDYVTKLDEGGLYVDVKCQADAAQFRARGVNVWRL